MTWERYVIGTAIEEEPTVPLHYPLVAVLAIIAAIAPNTWFLSSQHGYYVSGVVLCAIVVYAVFLTSVRLWTDSNFLLLFGAYWVGLVVQYHYTAQPELLQYVLVTPIAVVATVIVLPRFVVGRKETFAMALTVVGVCTALIGIWLLWRTTQGDPVTIAGSSPGWIGEEVGDYDGFANMRTVSVFHNQNTYGFFMMVTSLAALYTLLARRGLLWVGASGVCLLGLFMSEGDAAYLGFAVGAIVLVSGYDTRLAVASLGVGVVALYWLIRIGHIPEVMETTLMSRVDQWVLSLERIAEDPLFGIGFLDAAPEIGASYGPHNSFVHALLNAGIIVGSLYLGALAYAFARGLRRKWTPWTGFVVGSTVGLFAYMSFESLFLGGLGVSSVVLGLLVGLLVIPERDGDTGPVTAVEALRRSRGARAVERIQDRSDSATDSLPRGEEG
ncbi:O-antigen ligase family protein [Natronorarus salvus]|uniref:O-antigen ligase family protein n=1 Tax=Natronorarus salvus TaxID=3117733 RepID=UPI002F265D07